MKRTLNFYPVMIGTAVEEQRHVSRIKITIPELFPDAPQQPYSLHTGNKNIFINASKPPLSSTIQVNNYIELPVINGSTMSVSKGDRLLLNFVYNKVDMGFVIGKVG